jgi:glycosyl transferase family 25
MVQTVNVEGKFMATIYHFVISSAKAPERRKSVETNFAALGLEPCFFEAIMGNELSKSELNTASKAEGLLTLGEIGCALSHLAIYKELLKSSEPYVFVFEDDARLTPDFIANLPKIQAFMARQNEPTVLSLHRIKGRVHPVYHIGASKWIMHALGGSTGHGYVINRQAAENILKAQTPIRFEIDAWEIYQKLCYISFYTTNFDFILIDKTLASQSLIDGISPKRHDLDVKIVKRIKGNMVNELYNQKSLGEKLLCQLHRLSRHVKELYYKEL